MKIWILLLSFFFICCKNPRKHKSENFEIKLGDMLFQDLDSSPLCEAIEMVTSGYKNSNLSHVGIVVDIEECNTLYNSYKKIRVLEAIPNKVKTTRMDSFLNRSFDINGDPKVIVGRLKTKNHNLLENAITFLKDKIGEEYDNEFLIDNNSYYCSELIYKAFEKDSIFKLKPMTFIDPQTKKISKIWKEYYSKLNIIVPENKPGLNPGSMSKSDNIEIVHIFGLPNGIEK